VDASALEDEAGGRGGGVLMATAREIAELLGVSDGAGAAMIERVSGIPGAGPDALVFAVDDEALSEALASKAGLILAPLSANAAERVLRVKHPRTAFAQVYAKWFDARGRGGVHPAAMVEAGAVMGAGCEIGAGAYVASGAVLGEHCVIAPRVVIHAGTTLGNRVRVLAGAVLGSDGFGYARTAAGHIGFPQIGTLWIGDDVEIGANTTIDRGALGETRIGRGTKIDNLCHIAHNCVIGEEVLMAAEVGLAGSCVIEDGAMLGGQAGLGERVTIGRGVILGGQGGVLPGTRIDGEGVVYWGTPAQPVREYLRGLARMRKG
jgi:UDP-3-O-[3-hydroxymyristoyl] glucosamine N-acyltransferase